MKRFIFIPSLLILYFTTYSQEVIREEIGYKELTYLSKRIFSFSKYSDEQMIEATKNNLYNYEFEILYNDKVIYRGVLIKPFAGNMSKQTFQGKVQFCFDYETFDLETRLQIIENAKLQLISTESGKKYLCNDNYNLFDSGRNGDVIVNDKIVDNVKFKFYKLTYK